MSMQVRPTGQHQSTGKGHYAEKQHYEMKAILKKGIT